MPVELDQTVKDKITGFKGVVTGKTEYISGCKQVLVVPPLDKDGKPQEAQWFDEQRVAVDTTVPAVVLDNRKTPGPDREAPKQNHHNPKRRS